jgi:hypothetical protein
MNPVNFSIATPRFGKTALRSANTSPASNLQFGNKSDEFRSGSKKAAQEAQQDQNQDPAPTLKKQGKRGQWIGDLGELIDGDENAYYKVIESIKHGEFGA